MARGEKGERLPKGNICPVCWSDFFFLEGERAVCPVCGSEAQIEMEGGEVRLAFDLGVEPLPWSYAWQKEHLEGWIRPTLPRFLAHRGEIKARRERYRGMGEVWIEVPS